MRLKLLVVTALCWHGASVAVAQQLDPDALEATVGYINDLQGTDGGFRPDPGDRVSNLGATSSSLRALKYLGGRPRDKEGPVRFVRSCYDPASGGFALTPGGKLDVRSTAMGLMAMAELKMPLDEWGEAITRYFGDHARSLPDIYIAAAALDAAGLKTPKAAEWIAAFQATRNSNASYGKDSFDTAGAVITTLRLGGTVPNESALAQQLRESQQADGGFARMGQASDLSTTYRVMRALKMLEQKPDVERCRAFVARCRNDDGGYGAAPGQPSTASTTYFAAIVMHWLE